MDIYPERICDAKGDLMSGLKYLRLRLVDDNDLVIEDDALAERHARLTWGREDWILEDLESASGTWVDGERIAGPVVVKPGAQVGLGPNVVLSLEMGAPDAAPPVARGPAASEGPPRGKRVWRWLLVAGPVVLLAGIPRRRGGGRPAEGAPSAQETPVAGECQHGRGALRADGDGQGHGERTPRP